MTRNNAFRFIRALALSFGLAGALHAAGIDSLAAKADAVVIGSVDVRTEGATAVSFTINVSRVLSGTVPGNTVNVAHQWSGIFRGPDQTISQQLYGIWFLIKKSPENWDLLTARPVLVRTALGLFLPASQSPLTPPYAYPAGTGLIESLIYETAAGFQSMAGNVDPRAFLGAIDSLDTPAVRTVLGAFAASADPGLHVTGVIGGTDRSYSGAVSSLIRMWPDLRNDPNEPAVVSALRDGWRDTTPAAVQQLAAFAAALPAGSDIRAASIRALASIHTREALPLLGSLLTSASAAERERGVYGLSAFANGCPVQTRQNVVSMAYLQCSSDGPYKTPETVANFAFRPGTPEQQSSAVSFWLSWWGEHSELH